jgi:putative addiction module CopG family antidote
VTVNLSPELEQLVLNLIESGRYHSASEATGEALRLMNERDQLLALYKNEIRA